MARPEEDAAVEDVLRVDPEVPTKARREEPLNELIYGLALRARTCGFASDGSSEAKVDGDTVVVYEWINETRSHKMYRILSFPASYTVVTEDL